VQKAFDIRYQYGGGGGEEEEKVCVNAECPLHPKDKEQQKAILYPADCFRSMLRPVTVRSLILG